MVDDIKITISFQNEEYAFNSGAEAYIFHIGIYNGMHINYGVCELMIYVSLVFDCYLSDSNNTPLRALADYIAENWSSIKCKDRHEILNEFYSLPEEVN